MIRNTLAVRDDACNLFIGRAYALTREAASVLGLAHVDDLPEGGIPFHPNCTHSELPCVLKGFSEAERKRMMTMPPKWCLGKRWRDVQAEYKKRGGMNYAIQVNPNIAFAGPPASGPGNTFRQRGG